MADDVVVRGRTPLSESVNGRTLLVEHLFIIRDNVEIAGHTYVAVRRNRTAAENSVSKSEWYLPLISYSPDSCLHSDVIAASEVYETRWPGKCMKQMPFYIILFLV